MLGALRNTAARAAKQARNMSSKVSIQEEIKEMNKWRVVTYLSIPVCIAKAAYDLSHGEHHGAEVPAYPYMHIRSKDFPWGPDGLFEVKHEHH